MLCEISIMKSHRLSPLTLTFLLSSSVSQIRIKLRHLSISPIETHYKGDSETETSVKLVYVQISGFYYVVLVFVL